MHVADGRKVCAAHMNQLSQILATRREMGMAGLNPHSSNEL
jgi:hypothetical protein